MTASALSYTADGEIVEQTNIHFDGSGNLGIGTAAPASTMHIYKAATEQTTGLLIEKANGGTGSASIFFGVTATSETNNVGVPKAGIMFERTAGNGRGDLKFCVDYANDTNPVGVADANMTIKGSNGYVGIATTGPLAPLHVNGDIAVGASGALRRTADNDLINIYSGSDNTSPYIFMTGKSRTTNANKIGFRIGAADIVYMLSDRLYSAVKVGIGTTSPNHGLSISAPALVNVKQWNAFNRSDSASNYTFPESGIYLVGFMYANGDDSNISEYYVIGVGKGGAAAGVTRVKAGGGYTTYAIQNYDTVRFWAINLPSNYNNSGFYLKVYFAGYQ
jgi:hypothetical protein